MRGEWHHQDCNRYHSWLYCLSQRELTTIHGQHNSERILEYGRDDEIPHKDHDSVTTRSSYILTMLPRPQACTEPSEEVSIGLWFLQWEKSPKWMSISPQRCGLPLGSLHSSFTPQGLQGNLQGSTTRNLRWRRGVGAQNDQRSDPGRLRSYLQHPCSSPNQHFCLSAEPRQWCRLTRELSRVLVCLI